MQVSTLDVFSTLLLCPPNVCWLEINLYSLYVFAHDRTIIQPLMIKTPQITMCSFSVCTQNTSLTTCSLYWTNISCIKVLSSWLSLSSFFNQLSSWFIFHACYSVIVHCDLRIELCVSFAAHSWQFSPHFHYKEWTALVSQGWWWWKSTLNSAIKKANIELVYISVCKSSN